MTPIHAAGGTSVIQDAVFTANGQMGCLIHGSVTASHCSFTNNGRYGVAGGGASGGMGNPTIEYCLIDNNNTSQFAPDFDAGGTKFTYTNNMIVRYNWIKNNFGFGVWHDGTNMRLSCHNNVSENNLFAGFFYEISYGGTVYEHNYAAGNAIGNGTWPAGQYNGGAILVSCSPCDATGYNNNVAGQEGPNITGEIRYNDLDTPASGSPNGIALIDHAFHFEGKCRNWYVHHNRIFHRGNTNGRTGLFDLGNANLITQPAANNHFDFNEYHVVTTGTTYYECDGVKTLTTMRAAGHEVNGTEGII
jgi:hypothetical protein